ncbi:MAG TPA: hypothetical protein VGP25_10890 [Gemmatimonadaceae bacterium]|jgi:hypothetical protein|nr:hypothetical protein [Gemmatimonadaceae bacterium]
MRARLPRTIGVAAALFLAASGSAHAQGKGKDHGRGKGSEEGRRHEERRDNRHENRQAGRYVLRRDDGRLDADPRYDPRVDPRVDPRYDPRFEQRADDRFRAQSRRVPPGLANKPGGMPPGQYKKLYGADQGAYVLRDVMGRRGYTVLRTEDAGSSHYVYYRLRDGSVRRAVVSPSGNRLQFGNVPSSLLSEVLARLY